MRSHCPRDLHTTRSWLTRSRSLLLMHHMSSTSSSQSSRFSSWPSFPGGAAAATTGAALRTTGAGVLAVAADCVAAEELSARRSSSAEADGAWVASATTWGLGGSVDAWTLEASCTTSGSRCSATNSTCRYRSQTISFRSPGRHRMAQSPSATHTVFRVDLVPQRRRHGTQLFLDPRKVLSIRSWHS
jgi:hypothetical protein